jgi:ceramide glucosyltransferase
VQDHPQFQLLFGVRDADDPALDVVRRLQVEFPQLEIVIVADARIYGPNLKVSNLMNLLPQARHDWLVIADSDIAVAPDYLTRVVRPLARAEVGVVTCLYRGRAIGGMWALLGKQFIDDWFAPSVLLVRLFGSTSFGFGATLALRRDTLKRSADCLSW